MHTLLLVALALGSAGQSAQLQQARGLFQAGVTEYQGGHFQKAIQDFLAADKIKPSPIIAYNVAQAYEKLGDLSHAVEYYQDYLVRAPGASDRAKVQAAIKNLQAKLQAEPSAPVLVMAGPESTTSTAATPPASPPPAAAPAAPAAGAPEAAITAPQKPSHGHAVSITLGVIGVVAGAFAIAGAVEYQSLTSPIGSGTYKGTYPTAQGQASSANTWGDLGIVLGVVAVGALTGAVLTW